MIPFIDNIEYWGPLPNFSRDNMTWDEMQGITEKVLDLGHVVYCTTDGKSWRAVSISEKEANQVVDTQAELEALTDVEEGYLVWVRETRSGYILEGIKGHYIFQGTGKWAKIINEDGSVAGKTALELNLLKILIEQSKQFQVNTYETTITTEETSITILHSDHLCGYHPSITVYYGNTVAYSQAEVNDDGDVILSWTVKPTEEIPIRIVLVGKENS